MSEDVKQIFSSIAGRYDLLNHLLSFQVDRLWRKKAIRSLNLNPSKNHLALDLCAGTLDLSIEFLKQCPYSRILAADFCFPMLKEGTHKISTRSIIPVTADALNLPFKNETFDVVFCGYGFRNLDDKQAGAQEINRILKPGGKVVILDFFKPQTLLSRIFHHTYARFIMPLIGGLISRNKEAYRYLRNSIGGFLTTTETCQLFKKSGFSDVSSKDYILGISSAVTATK